MQLTCVLRWPGGRLVEVATPRSRDRFWQESAGGPPGLQLWRTVPEIRGRPFFDRLKEITSDWDKRTGEPIWLDQFRISQRNPTGVSHLDAVLAPHVVEVRTRGVMCSGKAAVPWFTYTDQNGAERVRYLTSPSPLWLKWN